MTKIMILSKSYFKVEVFYILLLTFMFYNQKFDCTQKFISNLFSSSFSNQLYFWLFGERHISVDFLTPKKVNKGKNHVLKYCFFGVVDHLKGVKTTFVIHRFCVYMVPAIWYLSSAECGISVNW